MIDILMYVGATRYRLFIVFIQPNKFREIPLILLFQPNHVVIIIVAVLCRYVYNLLFNKIKILKMGNCVM